MRGTHQREFMGVVPTGREITFAGVWLTHLRGGKIKEQWVYFDALGLLQQVGAIPAPRVSGPVSGQIV
jgi:predicted ester cyclase